MPELLHLRTIVSAPFDENTYIVYLVGRTDALVIDPGLEPGAILHELEELGRRPVAILNTHGHADHIAGNGAMKNAFPQAPLWAPAGDAHMLQDPWANLSALFGMEVTSPPADGLLREGDILDLAGIRLEVLEVPGHSPGHVVFLHRGQPCQVLGGDVLFAGSVGRTDFPGGNFQLLREGIHTKLFALPEDTVVYPGHGPSTTIGVEKRTNPFVGLGRAAQFT